MKFFIDTANLEQIKEAQDLWNIRWCNYEPPLMAKEGIKGAKCKPNITLIFATSLTVDVSAEVISTGL